MVKDNLNRLYISIVYRCFIVKFNKSLLNNYLK